jgi:hypothetical protein
MAVAQLERVMDLPEFVRWMAFYRWRGRERERKREMDRAKRDTRRGLRGSRGSSR